MASNRHQAGDMWDPRKVAAVLRGYLEAAQNSVTGNAPQLNTQEDEEVELLLRGETRDLDLSNKYLNYEQLGHALWHFQCKCVMYGKVDPEALFQAVRFCTEKGMQAGAIELTPGLEGILKAIPGVGPVVNLLDQAAQGFQGPQDSGR